MGTAEFKKFTNLTGIKVNLQTLPFDSVHDKTVAAEAAGTAPADIMEVDGSGVGQYAAAGWLTPIASYVAPHTLSTVDAKANFTIHGKLYGMPWVVDFRWTVVNMSRLRWAALRRCRTRGRRSKPTQKTLKSKGVLQYPITMPLNVTEESTEQWLTLMVSAGGTLLDAKGNPHLHEPQLGWISSGRIPA